MTPYETTYESIQSRNLIKTECKLDADNKFDQSINQSIWEQLHFRSKIRRQKCVKVDELCVQYCPVYCVSSTNVLH